jgi:hypothetical protein
MINTGYIVILKMKIYVHYNLHNPLVKTLLTFLLKGLIMLILTLLHPSINSRRLFKKWGMLITKMVTRAKMMQSYIHVNKLFLIKQYLCILGKTVLLMYLKDYLMGIAKKNKHSLLC